MKKFLLLLCLAAVILFCAGCTQESIVGQWTTEINEEALGVSMSGDFLQIITRLTFLEDGRGNWEVELVESREILHREFEYTLERNVLRLVYPDGTEQRFTFSLRKDDLTLTGVENYTLKRVTE